MRMRPLALLLTLFLTAGCFEIEQSITLDRNMSGTASFKLGIDMAPMVVIMAQMKHDMDGTKGPLTQAEIDAAKADFLKSATKKPDETALAKKEMASGLPKGITLLNMDSSQQELRMITTLEFGFDKMSNLVGVKLPTKEGGDPTSKSVIDSPFEGLEVIDSPKSFTIRSKPQNPAESVREEAAQEAPPNPEMEKMMKDAFKNLRVAYRITAPFEVLEHNATRKEGNTLIWEYDLARFEKMSASEKKEDIEVRVTYKK